MAPLASVKLSTARYGKDRVKVFRIVRSGPGGKWHDVVEYTVRAMLEGDIDISYTEADNSVIVATDSIKNTTNLFSHISPFILTPELFALHLALHFVRTYSHIHRSYVDIIQHRWTRIEANGKPHPHSFRRDGDDKRIVKVKVEKKGSELEAVVEGGLEGLLVLKSTGSNFAKFVRDEFTTLPEVSDRIFSTSVDSTYLFTLPPLPSLSQLSSNDAVVKTLKEIWKVVDFDTVHKNMRNITLQVFAEDDSASVQATLYKAARDIISLHSCLSSIYYALPNKHYIPMDLSYYKGELQQAGVKNGGWTDDARLADNVTAGKARVFQPVADPSGLITATVSRADVSPRQERAKL